MWAARTAHLYPSQKNVASYGSWTCCGDRHPADVGAPAFLAAASLRCNWGQVLVSTHEGLDGHGDHVAALALAGRHGASAVIEAGQSPRSPHRMPR